MVSVYPGGYDDLPDPAGSATLKAAQHALLHGDVNRAIEALQATLGIEPQGLANTVADRLKHQARLSVKDFGATGLGVVDDSQAIADAAAALQAQGGGTLVFPEGTYRVFTTDFSADFPTAPLADFSALVGVRIEGYGATLHVDRALATDDYLTIFELNACLDIRVEGLSITHEGAEEWAAGTKERGARLVYALGGCRDIALKNIGMAGGLAFSAVAASGAADSARTIGVTIDGLRLSRIAYGINCQFSGDGLFARNVVSDAPHRTYLVYGVRNHDVQITSKDQDSDDAIIGAFEGVGCEDMRLRYANTASTNASEAAACVAIQFGDTTPAQIRKVAVEYGITWPAAGYFGYGLRIAKYSDPSTFDTVDRGHLLEGLTLSGKGVGGGGTASLPVRVDGTWGAGETMRNLTFRDLTWIGTANPEVVLDSLKDRALLLNVVSDVNVYVRGAAAGVITLVGCKAASLCADNADDTPMLYIGCDITDAANQSFTNKSFVDTLVAGTRYAFRPYSLPVLVYSRTGESAAEAALRNALAALQLVTDNTVA